MTLDLMKERGVPLSQQEFDWRDMVRAPISKLDDDAFTRVRVILMNGVESAAMRFQHWFARVDQPMRLELARIRRVEQHQQTMVNWLLPPDQSALETTIGYEQVAIEVTASIAQHEPDPYLAQIYRFGLLEDFDHLYRYSALLDRLEGKDANNIIQSYTDIRPGRPTIEEHRHPDDDVREHYDRAKAAPLSKIHAVLLTGAEQQTHDYYMNVGPTFADPMARQLYAEIASIEEQHVTQYESLMDPGESWMERWLLHEAMEVYCYYSCVEQEKNPRVKEIWDRMLAYELGHLQHVMELFRKTKRDPLEILPATLPQPIEFKSHRAFVRKTLEEEIGFRAAGTRIVDGEPPGSKSIAYRKRINASGSPSETVANAYRWTPGTELVTGKNGNGHAARRSP